MPSLRSSPGFVLKLFFSNSLLHLIWLRKMLYINYCKLRQISRFDREVTRWKGKSSREHPVRSPVSAHPQTWKSTNALNLNILKLVRCCPQDNQGLSDPIWPRLLFKIVRCRCMQAASFGSADSSYSAHPLLVARSNGGRTALSRKAYTQSGKRKPRQGSSSSTSL